jgi:hypothetical protein
MTPLRQRMLEDMQLRGLSPSRSAPTSKRSNNSRSTTANHPIKSPGVATRVTIPSNDSLPFCPYLQIALPVSTVHLNLGLCLPEKPGQRYWYLFRSSKGLFYAHCILSPQFHSTRRLSCSDIVS